MYKGKEQYVSALIPTLSSIHWSSLSWDLARRTWLWWDGVQLISNLTECCMRCQQSVSTGQVVSLWNHRSNQHLCACQFYLHSEDFRKQKAWLTSGSHIWTLHMVWEHPGVAERCSLWCFLCDQRESFKQKVYQPTTLSQSLCSSRTRCWSQHLLNGFWIVILISRNCIKLFRKTICLLALLYS